MDPAREHDLEPVLISALEHYSYCPRQWALIYREQTFDENLYTLRGRFVHERVDLPSSEVVDGVRVERALPLWSCRLGLLGRADVVEFHDGVPYPVEYKYGRHSAGHHADLQLCAQALCLEEMLQVPVPKGAVYQVSAHRRREVQFTPELRRKVEETVEEIKALMRRSRLPPAVADARCRRCSLNQSCLPKTVSGTARLRALYSRLFRLECLEDVP